MTDLCKSLRAMPSSLNDACRTMEAAAEEIEALVQALAEIARQQTTDENFAEYGDEFTGDYEAGYDAVIRVAREELKRHVGREQ